MRASTRWSALLLAVAAAGCGSSSSDGSTGSPGLPTGSYLLRFESREFDSWPVSEWTVDYRFDLAQPSGEGGPLEGALAAPYRDPVAYGVALSDGELMLSIPPPPTNVPGDHLIDVRIALDGSKKVSVNGLLLHYPGELLVQDAYTASGELMADDVAPTASQLKGNAYGVPTLPWVEVAVVASEPLGVVEWQKSLSGANASAASVPLSFRPSSSPAVEWAGVSGMTGQIVDWLPFAGGGSLTVSGPGLTDLNGNVGELTPFTIPIDSLGTAQPSLDFTQVPGTSWGTMTAVTGAENGCTKTCLLFSSDACSKPAGGFAALLDRGTAKYLRIHYRLAAVAPDDTVTQPDAQLRAFTAGVELPGSPEASAKISVLASASFQMSASPIAGLAWATDSIVASIDLPNDAPSQIGFWLDANRPSECGSYTTQGGPQQDLAVILESVQLTDN